MRSIIMLLLIASITACATVKVPQPTGGSRADGTVDLSYQYGMFEEPQIDWIAAENAATQRCSAWGYSGAEAFGGQTQQCQKFNGYGNCIQQHVTVSYQCLGSLEK